MPFNVQTPVSTVLTNKVFNALYTLIFLSTVSTNKIPYSIHNSIALILCINSLDMPFNVQIPVLTVSTNIAFSALHTLIFLLTVPTNKIPYSIHNSIALILCIECLEMPFNVHTTDKVTMITVSQFLTI